jgi:hypothetical protein
MPHVHTGVESCSAFIKTTWCWRQSWTRRQAKWRYNMDPVTRFVTIQLYQLLNIVSRCYSKWNSSVSDDFTTEVTVQSRISMFGNTETRYYVKSWNANSAHNFGLYVDGKEWLCFYRDAVAIQWEPVAEVCNDTNDTKWKLQHTS